jgi:hypothetical protein
VYCEGSESEQAEVLVGCMLGDGTLEMRGLNARLRFIQALTQEGSVYAMLSSPRAVMVAQNYPLFRFAFLGPYSTKNAGGLGNFIVPCALLLEHCLCLLMLTICGTKMVSKLFQVTFLNY